MGLLSAVRYWKDDDSSAGLLAYFANVALDGDIRQRAAVLAANANAVRRLAPFAYLFANGFTLQSWEQEDIGENEYRSSLDARQLTCGFWPGAPTWDYATTTVVTAILHRDVTPFVHLLAEDEFALYCSPSYRSLSSIDRATSSANDSREAMTSLLADGGCVITASDEVVFRVHTIDDRYGQFFV